MLAFIKFWPNFRFKSKTGKLTVTLNLWLSTSCFVWKSSCEYFEVKIKLKVLAFFIFLHENPIKLNSKYRYILTRPERGKKIKQIRASPCTTYRLSHRKLHTVDPDNLNDHPYVIAALIKTCCFAELIEQR